MKHLNLFIRISVVALLFLALSCEKEEMYVEYKYVVTGTSGDYSVTIQNTDDNTQQWSSVQSGWWYKWEQTGERWLYISAQNNNSFGSVVVKIYRNNVVVSENSSDGGFSIASTSGTY